MTTVNIDSANTTAIEYDSYGSSPWTLTQTANNGAIFGQTLTRVQGTGGAVFRFHGACTHFVRSIYVRTWSVGTAVIVNDLVNVPRTCCVRRHKRPGVRLSRGADGLRRDSRVALCAGWREHDDVLFGVDPQLPRQRGGRAAVLRLRGAFGRQSCPGYQRHDCEPRRAIPARLYPTHRNRSPCVDHNDNVHWDADR